MIAKRLFLNHSPSEWFSFIQKRKLICSASLLVVSLSRAYAY